MAAEKGIERIRFEYKGAPYTLEFDRDTVTRAERTYGISMNDLGEAKLTTMQSLFAASFVKHHPKVSRSLINEMWATMGDKVGLYAALVEMYGGVASSVLEDGDEGNRTDWASE